MEQIRDTNGVDIEVGAAVVDVDGSVIGQVTSLVSLDGDVDDEGRPVGIGPFVVVLYDDGETARYTATWDAQGPEDHAVNTYTCDDVTVKS